MRIVDLIELKKQGKQLSKAQIKFLIDGYVAKIIPDYQMAAFLMAVYFKGMEPKEIAALTEAMVHSGKVYDLSSIKGIIVDKHSTGGVGDKVSLVLGPILGSLGVPMAKMSGRGLGHTGGTLDKLESIPGFRINLSNEEFINQVNRLHFALIGQSDEIVPADKLLYALRDVTATVDSIPLIASSIMSKKLATGSKAILLDVKCGDGAFMKDEENAKLLASTMIAIGKELNRDVRAEITNMSQPLGKAIGNKNEVLEAWDALNGKGPKDLMEVVLSSASTILVQAKVVTTESEGYELAMQSIVSGKAAKIFKEFVKAQSGDVDALLATNFWSPKYKLEIKAERAGFLNVFSALTFGIVAMKLGAGRATKESIVDFEAGIYLAKQSSEAVEKDELLFTLYSSKPVDQELAMELRNGYEIISKAKEVKLIIAKMS